jgi:hypothetical protein
MTPELMAGSSPNFLMWYRYVLIADENRDELVTYGAIPILVEVQNSKDIDVQYYTTAALSNLGISERHRTMMVAVGHCDVVRQLITLAQSPVEKIRCQACLALRNLACDSKLEVSDLTYFSRSQRSKSKMSPLVGMFRYYLT